MTATLTDAELLRARRSTDVSVAELSGSPSQVVAGHEEEKLLLVALREIPLELQTVVELYSWEELSVAQMAEVLEIPAGTVKSRLLRARDACASGWPR